MTEGGYRLLASAPTLEGSFSAVWTATIATKYSFCRVFRDLQDYQNGFSIFWQFFNAFTPFFSNRFLNFWPSACLLGPSGHPPPVVVDFAEKSGSGDESAAPLFLFFATMNVRAFLYVHAFCPETAQKTLEEMIDVFKA